MPAQFSQRKRKRRVRGRNWTEKILANNMPTWYWDRKEDHELKIGANVSAKQNTHHQFSMRKQKPDVWRRNGKIWSLKCLCSSEIMDHAWGTHVSPESSFAFVPTHWKCVAPCGQWSQICLKTVKIWKKNRCMKKWHFFNQNHVKITSQRCNFTLSHRHHVWLKFCLWIWLWF